MHYKGLAAYDGRVKACNDDGNAIAHHLFSHGYSGDAFNGKPEIAGDIRSKGLFVFIQWQNALEY